MIEPAELIVVEGLHALHETHADALDVRVYVDAPAAVRLDRWENLARTGERGWGVEETREFFVRVAEPTFHARSAVYRASAHVVVVNG
jgi:uridine kinase